MKARVSISRVSSSHRDDFISISINDDASGLMIWSGEMSMEDFAKTITAQAGLKAETKRIADKWSIGLSAGPAVSLNGSPTVSPTTDAL